MWEYDTQNSTYPTTHTLSRYRLAPNSQTHPHAQYLKLPWPKSSNWHLRLYRMEWRQIFRISLLAWLKILLLVFTKATFLNLRSNYLFSLSVIFSSLNKILCSVSHTCSATLDGTLLDIHSIHKNLESSTRVAYIFTLTFARGIMNDIFCN